MIDHELTIVRSVCPHDCPDACGMLAHVKDGRIVRVTGDPDHPTTRGAICGKAARYLERVYSPDRVLYPMARTGPKGAGEFRRISWDEALDTIAAKLTDAIRTDGPESILPYSFAGTMGVVNKNSMDLRFFHRLGASRLARTICSAAGSAGFEATMGRTLGVDPEATASVRYFISWGVNVASTNMHHLRFIQEARRIGAKFVHIDVHRNRTAGFADWFIQIRPGTDGALALGLMHVILRDSLEDREFIDRQTFGFEPFAERCREYPPERVARITGVPIEDIERLAREYAAAQPSFIRIGNGLQHHTNGGMTVRTIACLPALVGAWRHPGGGAMKSNGAYARMNERAKTRPDLLAGRQPRTINMNELGTALLEADPPVKALVVYNANPAVVTPDQRRVLQGLAREDLFTVVHEQLLTDTVSYADILLPATTHFEHTDLYTSYWHLYVQLARPAIAPLGEAMPNVELFKALAKRMGFQDACFDDTTDDVIRQALDEPSNGFLDGVTFDCLEQKTRLRLNVAPDYLPFSAGPLPTPSGKIELWSHAMAAQGLDPLPAYVPLPEGADVEGGEERAFPLLFITPPNHFFLNSTYANMPSNLRSEVRPTLEINPADAAARGIADGDPVRVFNDRGGCQLFAQVTDAVKPGVVVSLGLWWGRYAPDGLGVNATTSQRLADMAGGATFFTNGVEVAPVPVADRADRSAREQGRTANGTAANGIAHAADGTAIGGAVASARAASERERR